MPKHYRIIGSSPLSVALSDAAFRRHARRRGRANSGCPSRPARPGTAFEEALSFGAADPEDRAPLVAAVAAAEKRDRSEHQAALPPGRAAGGLRVRWSRCSAPAGLSKRGRVIVEKPFGTDLASARRLNRAIHAVFDESQVFRIDHFLGKESVDNILALRFANGLFEPIWNREHIAYVQIDVPETICPSRAGPDFFEKTGAYRDMVVTHLLQVLGIRGHGAPDVAHRQGPAGREGQRSSSAMPPLDVGHVVRGQYARLPCRARGGPRLADRDVRRPAGGDRQLAVVRGALLPAHRQVPGRTAARWSPSVSGSPPCGCSRSTVRSAGATRPNELVIDFDDPGWIAARFLAKNPGPRMRLGRGRDDVPLSRIRSRRPTSWRATSG